MKVNQVAANAATSIANKSYEEEKTQFKVMKANNVMAPVIGSSNKPPNKLTSELMMGLVNKKQP